MNWRFITGIDPFSNFSGELAYPKRLYLIIDPFSKKKRKRASIIAKHEPPQEREDQ